MVKVFEGTDAEFYMDGYLKSNLDVAKSVIKKDWDMVMVVDGYEGSGKSVLAQQIAYYCDPTLGIDRIVFTPKDFRQTVKDAKKYEAVVYDEAYRGLSSRGYMTAVNKSIVSMLTEIRQKNLFLFIVLPSIFELDKYVSLWRSRALLHVYSGQGFQRGFFAFYNIDKKKDLVMLGKKLYSYSHPAPNFTGRFTNHYTVSPESYKEKKFKITIEEEGKAENRLVMQEAAKRLQARVAMQLMGGELGISQKQTAQILNLTRQTIHRYTKEYENQGF